MTTASSGSVALANCQCDKGALTVLIPLLTRSVANRLHRFWSMHSLRTERIQGPSRQLCVSALQLGRSQPRCQPLARPLRLPGRLDGCCGCQLLAVPCLDLPAGAEQDRLHHMPGLKQLAVFSTFACSVCSRLLSSGQRRVTHGKHCLQPMSLRSRIQRSRDMLRSVQNVKI